MINCPNCHHENPEGALQCEACYTPLPALTTCPNCNASVQADASFCGQCGSDLRGINTSASGSSAGPDSAATEVASSEMAATEVANTPAPSPAPAGAGTASTEFSGVQGTNSDIKTQNFAAPDSPSEEPAAAASDFELPDLIEPDPLIEPEPIGLGGTSGPLPEAPEPPASQEIYNPATSGPATASGSPDTSLPDMKTEVSPDFATPEASAPSVSESVSEPPSSPPISSPPVSSGPLNESTPPSSSEAASVASAPPSPTAVQPPSVPAQPPQRTQLQLPSTKFKHVQTGTVIEIPKQLSLVRIGKPNDHTPPDIDVSGFPESEIVSRVHANLRVEGDTYYLEDVGSSNGTYINGMPLPVGNRHRLRPGDRIALGKGDKVSFIFESAL